MEPTLDGLAIERLVQTRETFQATETLMTYTDLPPIAERLRIARVMNRLSQADLARRVGLQGQSSIGEIERGRSARPTKLIELARELKCSIPWLLGNEPLNSLGAPAVLNMSDKDLVEFLVANPDLPGDDTTMSIRMRRLTHVAKEYPQDLLREKYLQFRKRYLDAINLVVKPDIFPETNATQSALPRSTPVPILGQAEGGMDGRFVLNGEQLALTFRPPSLVGVQHAYAVYVYGHSMEERFQPGDLVWVDPNKPVRQGDDVVVQIRPETTGDVPFGYVKRFVSRSGIELVLKQLNPPEGADANIFFPAQSVMSVHKVVFVEPG